MSTSQDLRRCKWSYSATNLLVAIWCHDLVQKQLKLSTRNQPIWESIARYMCRKGYTVTGLQCRTRIKNMLCSYHEHARNNESRAKEPYYDIFKKVLEKKVLRKKVKKGTRIREMNYSVEQAEVNKVGLTSKSFVTLELHNDRTDLKKCGIQKSDLHNEQSEELPNSADIKDLKQVILQAINKQTEAIMSAISVQSQMIKKLVITERQRFDLIVSSERENRKELETKLNILLDKLYMNIAPQANMATAAKE